MPTAPSARVTSNGLTVAAYPGDGDVLLAFSLDPNLLKQNDLAGFAIQYTPPGGQPQWVSNRLNFTTPVTASTQPQAHPWTSSQDAPIQKFHWVHFPPQVVPGTFTYKVTARYCQGTGLVDGPSVQVGVQLMAAAAGNFELGLTRGYISSQAYATEFKNAPVRPSKTLDYDTSSFQPAYQWLGFHARKMVFDLLQECVNDKSTTVDLFAYDIDEPDIVKMLESLGPRLRAFLDNASLHTKAGALEITVHQRLVKSAGAANVKQGHFQRFAHDKIIIQKRNGKATKVLTGSANFSIRGLYVQANNVLMFNDANIAGQYEQVFQSVFDNMSGYVRTPLAKQWFKFPNAGGGVPNFEVSFAPHPAPPFSMVTVADALAAAKSSVMFAVMELAGSGATMTALNNLHLSGKVFSYGMTQSLKGFTVYKPGQPGLLVPFATLMKQVPPPFDKEFDGGPGQTIHDKFIVIDFNDANPMVFTGSSNLADGGESQNGDNLLHISDPAVASVFATEAVRLVDHYYFRAAVRAATKAQPLQLTACGGSPKWWLRDYDSSNMRNVQRQLFANGPSAVTSIPSGVSDASPGSAPATAPAPKTAGTKKTSAKGTKTTAKKKAGGTKAARKKSAKKKSSKKKTARKKPARKSVKKKSAKKSAKKKSSKKKSARKKTTKKK
jgi:phosphatidylserine/phosphatidylglycerophosphate/cardiolipin synthase-like enzyme